MTGYVNQFVYNETLPQPYSGSYLEVEGYPSLTQSDEFGNYTLSNLSAGEHILYIYAPTTGEVNQSGVYNRTPKGIFQFTITADELSSPIIRDWAVNPTGNLSGRVLLEDFDEVGSGHGDIGAYIEELPSANVVSLPSGRFALNGLPTGSLAS